MSVHYKFKAALDFSTVTFDGIHISVSELKKSIIDQKRLGKNADFDLQIINAQTKEVYSDENTLIPKNTSVIVARIPITDRKKSGPPPKENASGRGMHHNKPGFHQQTGAEVAKGSDLTSMDLTEEEKIKAMMTQSTADYDPSQYVRLRGGGQHGKVPDYYRCKKCNQTGHWIAQCPLMAANASQPDVKKSTGIPRSFMVVVDSPNVPGALMTPEGLFAVPAVDHAAYTDKSKGQQPAEPTRPNIPDNLLCPLCNDLLTDAVLIPCCANSYCDDCIRNHLLESNHECPSCHEKNVSPTDLFPNRFFRQTVNAFKNESGYSKPKKTVEKPDPPTQQQKKPQTEEPRKLSLDELPDDLFPHSPKRIGSGGEVETVEDPESTKDLYDFNDGSIPSPFASPKLNDTKGDPPPRINEYGDNQAIKPLTRPFHPTSTSGPPGMMRGPPGGPAPSHYSHHGHRKPYGPGPPTQPPPRAVDTSIEPPPPGFDVLPPRDGASHRPPPAHGPNGGPDREGPPRDMGGHGMHRGPPNQQPLPGQQLSGPPPNIPPPSFNPMQPPPGYPGGHGPPPHGMPPGPPAAGAPPGYGGPQGPPHPQGPNQNMPPYSSNYNRLPPPPMGRGPPMQPMHHGGPPPRHHLMDRDEFGPRGQGKRPFGGPPPPGHGRFDDPRREEENRPGTIDDPLKEFERIMREKDRRKKMAAAGARKRSKSRSFSPSPRRVSPYPPKRSRSRSFSRSPSPKRKRALPVGKRRRYSRSSSRSPPHPPPLMRRPAKSRSRSRNRSLSPTPPGKLRRSPRRAPPQYSPSPPPSRFSRKDKDRGDDYFEGRGRDRDRERERERYDDRSRPHNKSTSSSTREYENIQPRHEGQLPSKYSDTQRQPLRPYHGSHLGGHGTQHDQSQAGYRDNNKPAPIIESSKRPVEFEHNIMPPGTEPIISSVPSFLNRNVQPQQQPPPLQSSTNVYQISTIGTGAPVLQAHAHPEIPHIASEIPEVEKPRRDSRDIAGIEPTPASIGSERRVSSITTDDQSRVGEDEEGSRKKSPSGKKHKKEKKKHKKKNKEEKKKKKKAKKSKNAKSDDDGNKSSDEEPGPLDTTENGQINTNKSIPADVASEEGAIPSLDGDNANANALKGTGATAILNTPADGKGLDSSGVADSSILAAVAKQTAPCDSTVKSPVGVHETDAGNEMQIALLQGTTGTLKRRDSLTAAESAHNAGPDVPEPKSSFDVIHASKEELHLPPSKWDEYDDFPVNTDAKSRTIQPILDRDIPPEIILRTSHELPERKITSDVLKRAEHVIFEKPSKSITDQVKNEGPTLLKDETPTNRYDMAYSFSHDSSELQSAVVQQVKSELKPASIASTIHRKSAKDRLGSKVSEDEAVLNYSKTIESMAIGSTRSKYSVVSSGGDSSNRRRSRSRSPFAARNSNTRNRDKESAGRFSPTRRDTQRDRRRSVSKDRRRSPSYERRRRSLSRDRRRSPSKDKRRSPVDRRDDSRGMKERKRSSSRDRRRSRERKSRSRERERGKDRRRSLSRERSRRSRSPDKDKSKGSSSSRDRGRYQPRDVPRPRSNSRDRSRRSRSGDKRSTGDRRRSISKERDRDRYRSTKPNESSKPTEDDGRKGKQSSFPDKYRLHADGKKGPSGRAGDNSRLTEEPPSPEARVFQQSSSGRSGGQVFAPTLKKQKRINIKLSSISKTEQQQQSGSSSSDEDGAPHHVATKHSDSEEEGKKRKKRRHSSTSTKSSSSSDAKKKKKKEKKKKKKKSK